MAITGGFGMTVLASGFVRRWFIDRAGIRRWVDNNAPCDPPCDRSACRDYSPGPCDNPDCEALQSNAPSSPAAKQSGAKKG